MVSSKAFLLAMQQLGTSHAQHIRQILCWLSVLPVQGTRTTAALLYTKASSAAIF